MRRLFEGGVTNAETLAAGGDYSRAATIRGRRLIDEIRYVACRIFILVKNLKFNITRTKEFTV